MSTDVIETRNLSRRFGRVRALDPGKKGRSYSKDNRQKVALIAAFATPAAAGLMLGVFGALVGAPQWARDLSPFSHTPTIGGGPADWTGGLWMLGAAVVVASIALALMRRRELRA